MRRNFYVIMKRDSLAGFQRHLATSMDFYRSGNGGVWWDGERALLQQGLDWCSGKRDSYGAFRYRLDGFDLRSIDNTQA